MAMGPSTHTDVTSEPEDITLKCFKREQGQNTTEPDDAVVFTASAKW